MVRFCRPGSVDVVVYGGPPSNLTGQELEDAVESLVKRLLKAELVLTDLAVVMHAGSISRSSPLYYTLCSLEPYNLRPLFHCFHTNQPIFHALFPLSWGLPSSYFCTCHHNPGAARAAPFPSPIRGAIEAMPARVPALCCWDVAPRDCR